MNQKFKTVKMSYTIYRGSQNYVWTESLKYQSTLEQARTKGFINRHRCRPIPNSKICKNKKYRAVDFEYKCMQLNSQIITIKIRKFHHSRNAVLNWYPELISEV